MEEIMLLILFFPLSYTFYELFVSEQGMLFNFNRKQKSILVRVYFLIFAIF